MGTLLFANGRIVPKLALMFPPLTAVTLVLVIPAPWYLLTKVVSLGPPLVVPRVSGRFVVIVRQA